MARKIYLGAPCVTFVRAGLEELIPFCRAVLPYVCAFCGFVLTLPNVIFAQESPSVDETLNYIGQKWQENGVPSPPCVATLAEYIWELKAYKAAEDEAILGIGMDVKVPAGHGKIGYFIYLDRVDRVLITPIGRFYSVIFDCENCIKQWWDIEEGRLFGEEWIQWSCDIMFETKDDATRVAHAIEHLMKIWRPSPGKELF